MTCRCPDCLADTKHRESLAGHYWVRESEGPPPVLRCRCHGNTAHPAKGDSLDREDLRACKPSPFDAPIFRTFTFRDADILFRFNCSTPILFANAYPANASSFRELSEAVYNWAGFRRATKNQREQAAENLYWAAWRVLKRCKAKRIPCKQLEQAINRVDRTRWRA